MTNSDEAPQLPDPLFPGERARVLVDFRWIEFFSAMGLLEAPDDRQYSTRAVMGFVRAALIEGARTGANDQDETLKLLDELKRITEE